jgi:predicted glutamine amidotransferase
MCIIIHQRKGKRNVTREEFNTSWSNNPDGFGIMYHAYGSVLTGKALNIQDAWDLYQEALERGGTDTDYVLHFRMATHGEVTLSNCHPFPCGNGKYLVHNGVFGFHSTNP